jgi:hypothetical protein
MIRLARWLNKGTLLDAGGAPLLDQSWHHVWNAASAMVTAVVSESTGRALLHAE